MSKKNDAPVTVTVRPDGSYYVEKTAVGPRANAPRAMTIKPMYGHTRQPIGTQITSTLKEVAGIAVAVKAVAPNLGPYGTLAALGFGVLRALATPEPPPQFKLRRVKVKGAK